MYVQIHSDDQVPCIHWFISMCCSVCSWSLIFIFFTELRQQGRSFSTQYFARNYTRSASERVRALYWHVHQDKPI